MGCVSLSPRADQDVVELGYYLHPVLHGKRIIPVAAKAVLRWAKEEFGVVNVFSSADCCNPRSAGVLERVSRETATGEVRKGTKILNWPVEKQVDGREVESLSQTWEWTI
jgi:RimJ/RimL family protein N-acetyltransferase